MGAISRLTDAEDLMQHLRKTAEETPYLLRNPEEVNITLGRERKFIQANRDSEKELMIVAFVDGKHVGNCSINSLGNYERYQHRCNVAIALYQEYCGLGIGKQMLRYILDVAASCGYEQAELEVVCENKNAVALYEALGFEKYATQYHSMKYPDGSYADEYLMIKKLV